jgi:hypothetical protein
MIHGLADIKSFWLQAVTTLDIKGCIPNHRFRRGGWDSVVEVGRAKLIVAGGQTVPVKYVVPGNAIAKPGSGTQTSGT